MIDTVNSVVQKLTGNGQYFKLKFHDQDRQIYVDATTDCIGFSSTPKNNKTTLQWFTLEEIKADESPMGTVFREAMALTGDEKNDPTINIMEAYAIYVAIYKAV